MEFQFERKDHRCMKSAATQTQTVEETLELRIPEGMQEQDGVLAVWGQPLVRGKEWRSNEVQVSGGVVCHVLCKPEQGNQPQAVEGWIPFRISCPIKDSQRDGVILAECTLAGLDARQTGAGRMLVRAQISAAVQAMEPAEISVYRPCELPEDIQLLKRDYPVCLITEAGERTQELEEDLVLPPGNVEMEQVISYRMSPEISEVRLMADKLVYRGHAAIRMIYLGVGGRLGTYETDLPLSQYIQLDREYADDAQATVVPAVTELEIEKLDGSRMRIKGGIAGQYVIYDCTQFAAVEDGYSALRTVELARQTLKLPAILERQEEVLPFETALQARPSQIVDCCVHTGQPDVLESGMNATVATEGAVQLLYYDENNSLQSAYERWEQKTAVPMDDHSGLQATVRVLGQPETMHSPDGITARCQLKMNTVTMGSEGPEMITAITAGEVQEPMADRPSLILRKAGGQTLWELAKKCRSTPDAIANANGLTGDPEPDRMLLIPVM